MEKFKSKQNCEELLYPLILDIFEESKKTYGVRRIKTALLNKHRLMVNHKCIRRIMHQYNLVCVLPKLNLIVDYNLFGRLRMD